ncbi:IS66 family transposase [Paraburkholderia caribensis]|uniref:IS66 family transposase n=1 Tax=Paraburkholderia caribensis TaxID=75105 RepID=UPI0034D1B607
MKRRCTYKKSQAVLQQRKSYMWAQMNGTGPPVRMFSCSPTCSAAQAAVLYAGIKPGAVLLSDGYEPYNEIARTNRLVHLGCWTPATLPD